MGVYRVRLVGLSGLRGQPTRMALDLTTRHRSVFSTQRGQLVDLMNIPLSFQNVDELPVVLEKPMRGHLLLLFAWKQAVYEQVVNLGEVRYGFSHSVTSGAAETPRLSI